MNKGKHCDDELKHFCLRERYFKNLMLDIYQIPFLSPGHNNVVRCISHSPTGPAFVTCSDDFRARFWYRKAETE